MDSTKKAWIDPVITDRGAVSGSRNTTSATGSGSDGNWDYAS